MKKNLHVSLLIRLRPFPRHSVPLHPASNFMQTISETHFQFEGQTGFYRGKVRDVYFFGDLMAAVATDRISAFDVILPVPIPNKGQILNTLAARALKATEDIVPNWVLDVPDPNVTVGKRCEALPIEMVVRGYLVGHAWREYASGKRQVCGVALPDGLQENDKLPHPIITPTTKAKEGHDLDISRQEIIAQGLVEEKLYGQTEAVSLKLYERGQQLAASRGLILADTKYEFGIYQGELTLIDEAHTPDSSRYFYAEGFDERQKNGLSQKQLSKEFVRKWLIENGFQGKEGQVVPEMAEDWVLEISARYQELFEMFTGDKPNILGESENLEGRIEKNIRYSLFQLL